MKEISPDSKFLNHNNPSNKYIQNEQDINGSGRKVFMINESKNNDNLPDPYANEFVPDR